MPDGNGHDGDKQKVKHCPFLNEWCIRERCALYSTLSRNANGLQQKIEVCGFNAVVLILSEINQKTQIQQQEIQLPELYRG